jgi:formylglycine-generating enzyme required for sulfatase activity
MYVMTVPIAIILSTLASVSLAGETPIEPKMVLIAGGTYPLGANAKSASVRPPHKVALAAFRIDAYEVTNAQFATFLNTLKVTLKPDVGAGALSSEDVAGPDADRVWGGSRGGTRVFIELDDSDAGIEIINGRFAPSPGAAERPASESTWRGAVAFCKWRHARLPTEAEWEATARGKQARTFPWGETPPTPDRAVFAVRATKPVGGRAAGATPQGVYDLAGNIAEWTSSLFKPYPYDATDGREDLSIDAERVTRGGDYTFDVAPEQLTGYFRDGFSRNPVQGHRHIGLRCAKDAG